MIGTKQELTNAMQNVLQNFILGMLLSHFVRNGGWTQLPTVTANFSDGAGNFVPVDLLPVIQNLADPADRGHVTTEFEKSLRRSLLAEGHEAILAYCEATNQFPKYKAQPWFQFARVVRNLASHKDSSHPSWPSDLDKKGITTISWRGNTVDKAMVGGSTPFVFTPAAALLLFKDQIDFAASLA